MEKESEGDVSGPTVRVRIAVAVDGKGKWSSHGYSGAQKIDLEEVLSFIDTDDPNVVLHYVEADVPIPGTTTVEGSVQEPTA